MMLMASGDHHFVEHLRFEECIRVHCWIAEQVAKERPVCFLSGGDIYERASTPTERMRVSDFLCAVAETCPVLITKGNHDRALDCALLGRLQSKHPITVVESCGVFDLGGIRIAAVAYPNRASIAAMVNRPLPAEALDDVAREALRGVLLGLSNARPDVLLGHFMINGSVTSVGQPLIGAELNVGLADLALARTKITIASHIHRPQAWDFDGAPIVYCGSPYRTKYGETETKSILVADVCKGGVEWSRLVTPATPMILAEDEWGDTGWLVGWHGLDPEACRGAEIRMRYEVASDRRDAAKAAAARVRDDLLARGAVSVKTDEVVQATTRARTPEIVSAVTIADKLDVLWRSKRIEMPGERRGRVLQRLAELEAA
jgi:DNA repair exonuclease SbcCD nuclease subunit